MLNLLQINLWKNDSACSLMEQTAKELESEILILSEILRGFPYTPRWISSSHSKSAIAFTTTARFAAIDTGRYPGYASMAFSDLIDYSCYWTPAGTMEEFEGFLSTLEIDVRSRCRRPGQTIIIAGDFNSNFPLYGSKAQDARGAALKRFVVALDLWVANVRSLPTFSVGSRSSVMDVTNEYLCRTTLNLQTSRLFESHLLFFFLLNSLFSNRLANFVSFNLDSLVFFTLFKTGLNNYPSRSVSCTF